MNAIGVHIVRFVCNLCSMSISDRSLCVCVYVRCPVLVSVKCVYRWKRVCSIIISYHRENIVFAVLVGWLLSFRLTRYPIHLLHFSGLSHQFDCYNTDSTHRKTEKKAKASIIHSCSSCEYTHASNAKYSLKDERERERKKGHNTQQPQKQRLRQLKKHSRRMNTQKWIKQQQQQFIVSEWRRRRRTIETKATERAKVKTIKQAETEKSDTHTHTHAH